MTAQARVRNASWMSSRISQRIRKAPEPVRQGDGLHDDPSSSAESRAVHDAARPDLMASALHEFFQRGTGVVRPAGITIWPAAWTDPSVNCTHASSPEEASLRTPAAPARRGIHPGLTFQAWVTVSTGPSALG